MKASRLALALIVSSAPAWARVAPSDVRPSTICSAYLDRVEDAGEPALPRGVESRLVALQLNLDRGVEASRARLGPQRILERLRDLFRAGGRVAAGALSNYRVEDVTSDELSREQILMHARIDDAIGELRRSLDDSDRTMPVRRIARGRAAVVKYLDELVEFSLTSEEAVRAGIDQRRRAAETAVDDINHGAHERIQNLRERRGRESEPRAGEERFGPAWRARWFGPSSDLDQKQRARIMAGYGLGAAGVAAASAFASPLAAPAAVGTLALGGWFGLRYHLFHLVEKTAVHVRAEYAYRRWKHWDAPRAARREARAPRAEGWLANMADLRDFASRTDVPHGLGFSTYDVDLPLDSKFFGSNPPLDGQKIRTASATRNPSRLHPRRVRILQTLEFDEANEPVLVTTTRELPHGWRRVKGWALAVLAVPF